MTFIEVDRRGVAWFHSSNLNGGGAANDITEYESGGQGGGGHGRGERDREANRADFCGGGSGGRHSGSESGGRRRRGRADQVAGRPRVRRGDGRYRRTGREH